MGSESRWIDWNELVELSGLDDATCATWMDQGKLPQAAHYREVAGQKRKRPYWRRISVELAVSQWRIAMTNGRNPRDGGRGCD